jgi:hypothetical protein
MEGKTVNLKPWSKMPTSWIQDGGLKNFRWKDDGSSSTAALMIYFVLCQFAAERPLRPHETQEPELKRKGPAAPLPSPMSGVSPLHVEGEAPGTAPWAQPIPSPAYVQVPAPAVVAPNPAILALGHDGEPLDPDVAEVLVARLTYDDLSVLTKLSRNRINAGLQKLIAENMIWRVDRSSSYGLLGSGRGKRWVKLPGRALMSPGSTHFAPFSHFHLRSKHELNALKLHLYYAHTRSEGGYSEVGYEKIFDRTGVSERDIARANSFLLSCNILQRTRGLPGEDSRQHEANKYFLTGYESFFFKKQPV